MASRHSPRCTPTVSRNMKLQLPSSSALRVQPSTSRQYAVERARSCTARTKLTRMIRAGMGSDLQQQMVALPGADDALEVREFVRLDLLEGVAEMAAEQLDHRLALLEAVQALAQRARQRARPFVGAALHHFAGRDLVANADIAARQHSGDGEIRIGVGARQAVFDAAVGRLRDR